MSKIKHIAKQLQVLAGDGDDEAEGYEHLEYVLNLYIGYCKDIIDDLYNSGGYDGRDDRSAVNQVLRCLKFVNDYVEANDITVRESNSYDSGGFKRGLRFLKQYAKELVAIDSAAFSKLRDMTDAIDYHRNGVFE